MTNSLQKWSSGLQLGSAFSKNQENGAGKQWSLHRLPLKTEVEIFRGVRTPLVPLTSYAPVLNRFLTDKLPEGFLKSNYFTLRPQLVQLYQEDPTFRTRLEEALDRVEEEVARDHKMLVNETNRTYLSKYPFEEVARALGIQPSVRGFSASKNKLDTIKQHSLTIPGATQKFTGLQQLSETYTRTPESKYINVQHFMRGLQDKMTNDQDFVQSVLRNGSRSYQKVNLILEGKSIL